mmetsp:Transcript_8368/g.11902  ORF Transcript_8368/g.11902 Transcript_8368/m.11902 type:complete len:448 (+) Transcript_8368:99-1442(+)
MDYQYSGEDEEIVPVIEQRGYVDNDQPNVHQVDEAVQRVLSDRQWIDETEYRYERAQKHLKFSVMANCVLFILILGFSIGIAKQSGSGGGDSSPAVSETFTPPVISPTYTIYAPSPTQGPPPTIVLPVPTNPPRPANNPPPPTKGSVGVGGMFVPTMTPIQDMEYVQEFKDVIMKTAHRPLGQQGQIAVTFGPQFRDDCSCYEFHRGIDLVAPAQTPIVASYGGVVERIINVGKAGIILKHRFADEVEFHTDKPETFDWYSLYFHAVDWKVNEGDEVSAGQVLALLTDEHLHYEVRIGSPCDYEDYVSNPQETCNSYGFDPHVHPLLTYPLDSDLSQSPKVNMQLTVHQDISSTQDAVVAVSTQGQDANIDRYRVAIVEPVDDVIFQRQEHVLDLNLREGFDASMMTSLNTPDKNKPYLDPQAFDENSEDWDLVVNNKHKKQDWKEA